MYPLFNQGGGGAQSLESLRLRLLAAREAAPGQALLLALDAPARDLAQSLRVGWWFVPTTIDSADGYTDEMYRALTLKAWFVVPKCEGAARVEKLRDLEQAEEALKAENQKLSRQMADKLDQAAEEAQA